MLLGQLVGLFFHHLPVLLEFVNGLLAVVDLQYSLDFADGVPFFNQPD
jgi:hypothetical protein